MQIKKIISVIFLFVWFGQVSAQITKSHEIGKLWETMFPIGSLSDISAAPFRNQMVYPGGDFVSQNNKNLRGIGLWIGTKSWTDTAGVLKDWYVAEIGFLNGEGREYGTALKNKKKVRYRLPIVTVNDKIEQRVTDTRSSSSRSSTIPADEQIETTWASAVGINVKMRSYALANENHNSYIIKEYTFTNDGNVDGSTSTIELPNQNLQGVYFGFAYYLIPSQDRGHAMVRQSDDWAGYYGNRPAEGDSLRGLFYVFDGDADDNYYEVNGNTDDVGDPDKNTGEFLSPQYPAFGVLHADKSWDDPSDDRSQPSTVNILPQSRMKSHNRGNSDRELYADMSSGLQSRGTIDYKETGGNPYDPDVIAPAGLLSFGPYDIPFGESVTIVLYEAVGSISKKLAIQEGQKWLAGDLEFDGLTGNEAKNALIATGKDSLFINASRAEFAWNMGLENLPTPPPSPNLTLISGPGKITLEWESVADEEDWLTKENDFWGYRIYRAQDSWTNIYSLIWEIKGDTTQYTDRHVERGRKYYYAVTAVDDGTRNSTGIFPGQMLESSRYYNRNAMNGAIPFQAGLNTMDSIYVVPNPFHVQGLAYGGNIRNEWDGLNIPRLEDKISFVGLPPKATIRIFTMSGNLVATIPHPNPENPNSIPESADEEFFQISDYYQMLKSGVYVYHIEGWDLEGNPLGTASGNFIIIR